MKRTAFRIGFAVVCLFMAGCGGDDPSPGAASITVTGTARYEDRLFNKNGFTGEIVQKPIRTALIEMVTTTGERVIGSASTDGNGKFTLTGSNSGNPAGVYLRVVSQSGPGQSAKITILNNAAEKALLSARSASINDGVSDTVSVQKDILATAAAKIGGAFNILDVLVDASEFVQAVGQAVGSCTSSPSPYTDCVPPLVTVYWEPGSAEGTFYDTATDAITLLGGGDSFGDADEYDDGVIIHEYGHFIASKFLRDDSPGGPHGLTENGQDIRLSWSEGWANFFAVAVQNSPVYVDTSDGGAQLSVNMETYASPSVASLPTLAIYTTSEIAVSGVLWDLFDPVDITNPGENDPVTLNFSEIFQTFLSFPAPKPTTLETFWLQFEQDFPGSTTAFQTILTGRQIALFPDATEGAEQGLGVGGSQDHTLYQTTFDHTEDIDIIPLNNVVQNTQYTVKTFGLKNGADTILTIQDTSGTPIAPSNDNSLSVTSCPQNCPKNGPSTLASSVTFNSGTNTTLNAHVRRSPNAPPSAAQFGSYSISLSPLP